MTRRRVMAVLAFFAAMLGLALLSPILSVGEGAAQSGFPFERELLLDVEPMRGSKRVPGLEINARGAATVDLWCKSGTAQIEVRDDALAVTLGPLSDLPCTPERAARDDELLAALAQVTHWRWDGPVLVLTGTAVLRYRPTGN